MWHSATAKVVQLLFFGLPVGERYRHYPRFGRCFQCSAVPDHPLGSISSSFRAEAQGQTRLFPMSKTMGFTAGYGSVRDPV
ncbi:Hypothetical protein DEACI_3392 [Acididesulfobacillus acetoxydans]|uniref:Uncharacterized protein n=1 Tax=Acididesulfobacillus acetoxydans TaxID=1561005 RepID=A0A8S0VY77_9FIRM|nr:Hypothetical protein DEACI_3392 [Acididesulfobacillus acetoxydans]CEJ06430.1 Hypothetical protein DEACI_0878 [Acididesulfobacillus acetoxydans]